MINVWRNLMRRRFFYWKVSSISCLVMVTFIILYLILADHSEQMNLRQKYLQPPQTVSMKRDVSRVRGIKGSGDKPVTSTSLPHLKHDLFRSKVSAFQSGESNPMASNGETNSPLLSPQSSCPSSSSIPTIYMVTPTFTRLTQLPDLIRLSHTLILVPNVHWILIEDASGPTEVVSDLISRLLSDHQFKWRINCFSLKITRLYALTPPEFKVQMNEPNWYKPRGVNQRNEGLKFIRGLRDRGELDQDGIIYFGDDDNTYDVTLFDQMRLIKGVGVWPVGLVGGLEQEGPVCRYGKIVGFNAIWKPTRPFPIDMAGFAIHSRLLVQGKGVMAIFSFDVPRGHQESHLLSSIINDWTELETIGDCDEVRVWHTRTERFKVVDPFAKPKREGKRRKNGMNKDPLHLET